MNDSIYEEYMRNVLGYQSMNTYNMDYYNWDMQNMTAMNSVQMQELEKCYPDIYRIVYPMIQKVCMQNTRHVTRELIDRMTDEIYFALEDKGMIQNRNKDEKNEKNTESAENRQTIIRNTGLNDLIRILLLRELLGRPGQENRLPLPPARLLHPPMRSSIYEY